MNAIEQPETAYEATTVAETEALRLEDESVDNEQERRGSLVGRLQNSSATEDHSQGVSVRMISAVEKRRAFDSLVPANELFLG